jgi:hypothetical protein
MGVEKKNKSIGEKCISSPCRILNNHVTPIVHSAVCDPPSGSLKSPPYNGLPSAPCIR